ncbi:hypothetical protein ACWD48_05210 [Streptomyces sp. NPDC002519]
MSDSVTYQDRMFLAGEAIYQRIHDGQVHDVEAELLDAKLQASQEGETA